MKKLIIVLLIPFCFTLSCSLLRTKNPMGRNKTHFETEPNHASVYVDGVFRGITPITLKLNHPMGRHPKVTLMLDEYPAKKFIVDRGVQYYEYHFEDDNLKPDTKSNKPKK